jgi:hypothetical protein
MATEQANHRPERARRTFRCTEHGEGVYSLNVLAAGEIVARITLTQAEVRDCADCCLMALGWTAVDYRKAGENG